MIGLLLALVIVAFAPQPAPSPAKAPELDAETATRLIAAWPGLDTASGRKLASARGGGGNSLGIAFIEFRLRDAKGGIHTGVGFAARSEAVPPGRRTLAVTGGWSLIEVVEDKTLDDVIESLRRSRVEANESAALGRLRTVVSGELAYASSNGSSFDIPSCLTQTATCLPPGSRSGVGFLSPRDAALNELYGYRYRFEPGASAKPRAGTKLSPSSVTSFAITAIPIKLGESGELGFCADDQGHVCASANGSEPTLAAGRCAFPCPSVAAAFAALGSEPPRGRVAAARALGRMAEAGMAEALAAAFNKEADGNARLELTDVLAKIGGPVARGTLRTGLKDSDISVRLLSARTLSHITTPPPSPAEHQEIVAALTSLLADRFARAGAIEALGALADPSMRSNIERHLEDPDPRVRESAKAALEKLGKQPAAGAPAKTETGWSPPSNAVRVGGAIKMPQRVSMLKPVYPAEARRKGVTGVVVIEALLDEKGTVAACRVLRGVPELDAAALESVKGWVYEPTVVAGKTVPLIVTLTVSFNAPKPK